MRRAVGPLLVAAAVLTAAGAALGYRPIEDSGVVPVVRKQSGLHGTVYRGPIRPVCTQTEPCEAPAPGVTLSFTREGAPAVHSKTGAKGSYKVFLRAAVYTVRTNVNGIGRKADPYPHRVRVRPGHMDKIDFRIDTGIR